MAAVCEAVTLCSAPLVRASAAAAQRRTTATVAMEQSHRGCAHCRMPPITLGACWRGGGGQLSGRQAVRGNTYSLVTFHQAELRPHSRHVPTARTPVPASVASLTHPRADSMRTVPHCTVVGAKNLLTHISELNSHLYVVVNQFQFPLVSPLNQDLGQSPGHAPLAPMRYCALESAQISPTPRRGRVSLAPGVPADDDGNNLCSCRTARSLLWRRHIIMPGHAGSHRSSWATVVAHVPGRGSR